MKTIVSRKRKQESRMVPMRNVYANAIRCYIVYLMVMVLIVSPSAISTLLTSATTSDKENQTNYHEIILEKGNELKEFCNFNSIVCKHIMISNIPVSTIKTVTAEIEQRKAEEVASQAIVEEPVIVDYNYMNVNGSESVKVSSGLSAAQIDELLCGTDLYGIGQEVYNVEINNGISAYFTIAVASLESGYGSSNLAKRANNIFGMLGCSFSSVSECVQYFGTLMNEYEYLHNITMNVNGIAPRYCEGNLWAGKVVRLMNQYINKANSLY